MEASTRPAVRCLVFDMGGVLLDYQPERYCRALFDDKEEAETVYRELFAGEEWKRIDAGAIGESEATALVRRRIPRYADGVRRAMERWPESMTVMPGMPELLRRLRAAGYPLYLLSNTSLRFYSFSRQYEMFGWFSGRVISAREKLAKPDPAIYRLLLRRFALRAQECLFIDDTQENIDAARQIGMAAHRFRGTDELGAYLTGLGLLPGGCAGPENVV